MAGSVESGPANRPFPWQAVLVANGCASALLGLVALVLAGRYSADVHGWVRRSSAEEFAGALRVAVLCYVLYGLTLLGAGLTWLSVGARRRRKGRTGAAG